MAAYPGQSSWRQGTQYSLWWGARFNNLPHICASQGRTGVWVAQRRLRALLPLVYEIGGTAHSSINMGIDGKCGPITLGGLLRWLQDKDVPADVTAMVSGDFQNYAQRVTPSSAQGLPLSMGTEACLIWVAFHSDLNWSELAFPTMESLLFDVIPADDGAFANVSMCWDVSVTGPNGTAPPIIGATTQPAAPATPTPAPAGGNVPQVNVDVPPPTAGAAAGAGAGAGTAIVPYAAAAAAAPGYTTTEKVVALGLAVAGIMAVSQGMKKRGR